ITAAIFTKILLFTIARVAIFLYILSLAARTFQSYLYFHTFNNTLFSLLFYCLFFTAHFSGHYRKNNVIAGIFCGKVVVVLCIENLIVFFFII
ncbi:hypothetical protein QDY71_11660, partial [Kingella negevensis]